MSEQIIKIALDVLAVLAPVLAAMLVELLRRKLGTEKLQHLQSELAAKQDLAILAVRFAEQVYKEAGGPEKYNSAAMWLSERALDKGLLISAEEVRGLIEAALRELKDSFGEEWAKAVTK